MTDGDGKAPESVRTRLRREAGRVDAGCAISLTRENGARFEGVVTDISDTGLFVATETSCAVGERLVVRFRLPGSSAPVEAKVEVRSPRAGNPLELESRGFGVAFTSLDETAKAAVERFVRG